MSNELNLNPVSGGAVAKLKGKENLPSGINNTAPEHQSVVLNFQHLFLLTVPHVH